MLINLNTNKNNTIVEGGTIRRSRQIYYSKSLNNTYFDYQDKLFFKRYVREYGRSKNMMGLDDIKYHDYIYNLPDDAKAFIVKEYEKEYEKRVFRCTILGIIFILVGSFMIPLSVIANSMDLTSISIIIIFIIAGSYLVIFQDYTIFWIFYATPSWNKNNSVIYYDCRLFL